MIAKELKNVLHDLLLHKKKLSVVAFAGIVSALCKGYLPIFVQQMIASSSSYEKLSSIAWIGLGLAFAMGLSRYFHIFTMNIVAERVSQSLREKLQFKFINLDLKFHNKYSAGSGGLLSRTFNDVRVIQDGLRLFADLFSAPLTFIFLLIALFRLELQLTCYILLAAPILAFALTRLSKGIRKYSLQGTEQLEKMTSTIKESLDGVRTIQSFSLQNILKTKLEKQGLDFLRMRKGIHARIEFMGPFTEFLATFIILGIIFYFSAKIASGQSDTSNLIGFITAMLQINEPIKKFQEAYVRVQETRVSAHRIYSMLEEESSLTQAISSQTFPADWSIIEYKNINFSYDEKLLLNNFNLTVRKGQTIAFVGESGSGKSTIVNLLARFYDPQSGAILIDQKNIKDFELNSLRKNISLVSQDVFLFSDSIEKNIQGSSENLDEEKLIGAAKAAHAYDFISSMPFGFKTPVGERGNLLSGGEKQRIAIARAIYKDSPILILDEATSALDSVSEELVQKGLNALMKGRTTFVIAHRLSTVLSADVIVVMKNGKIVELGSHKELIDKNQDYAQLFNAQNRSL